MSNRQEAVKQERNKKQEELISNKNSKYLIDKNGRCETDNYARLFKSLIYDEKYTNLTQCALVLLSAMVAESKGSTEWFSFPKSRYERLMNKDSFAPARNLLVEKGFIDCLKFKNGGPSKYKLSDRWQKEITPPWNPYE